MAGVLNDLVTAVQGIRLYLAGPYGPPPPLHPAMAAGQQALPWYRGLGAAARDGDAQWVPWNEAMIVAAPAAPGGDTAATMAAGDG